MWAHRGGAALAPENTIGAFKNAAAIFASRGLPVNLELDVHLSSDRIPMVRLAGIRTMLLTVSTLPGAPEGAGFTLTENAAYATARGYEVSAPDDQAADMSAEGVAVAHALGREVITWTVDSLAAFMTLAAYGVDGVITNDPDALTSPVL